MIDYSKFRSSLKRLEEQYENYRRLDTSLLDLTQDGIAESVVQRFKTCYGCLKKAQACLALMPVSSMARSRPPSGQTRSAAQRTTASRSSRPVYSTFSDSSCTMMVDTRMMLRAST